ncbi:riboflavin biosynthesis protein RibF [Urbifossiella limnaea]|uniref:Riboflavin biosynthesis protein n=1 Tax=Urbifossiella limnaea TaxID=2528023 RepID=A0A517XYW6_9BACT|nr:riboflavin biosynthesis protein RibF [Urbifossiella limnaea]QDU22704.1 Riboflavin kinase [Urbifossiella limnaea]
MTTATLDRTAAAPPGFAGGAVTVGNFDGVHRGHQALVAAAARWAARLGGPAVAVTFDPPPYSVLVPDAPPRPPLTTTADRADLLRAAGADRVIVYRPDRELLALPPAAFVRDVLLRQLGSKAVVEGYDFRFGRGRAGDTAMLADLCAAAGVGFEEVPPLADADGPVSSSRVRAALLTGNVEGAAALLGRPYRVTGKVVSGARRGRTIGFPTANLGDVPTLLPGNGVYAVRAAVNGATWPAAANVGPNPTFSDDARKVEVHLIGFAGDLYGAALPVEFVAKLRDTRPFGGAAELVAQLARDVAAARGVLGGG